MSFLDPITAAGPATELDTTGAAVNVNQAAPPTTGQVLTATDATHATWQTPSGGGGGGGDGGNAGGLETSGAPVDVASAAPPVAGQVLMATDAEHATWRVPGLHYDPSIKFWTSSAGSATIEPGTWGFIEQGVGATTPIVVSIVSSLDAPPVDSRFGLYVGRDVTVPVSVTVLGASQIQGLDGELGTSTPLLPGADYEWVFYHEGGAALWGLVSDTAAAAKRLWVEGGMVELTGSPPPTAGDVLKAVDANHAAWGPPGASGLTYIGASGTPLPGQWCLVDSGVSGVTTPADAVAGDTFGVFVLPTRDVWLDVQTGQELSLGNWVGDPSESLRLRGGSYYEWTLQPLGEVLRWMPRGTTAALPAPLWRRDFGVTYPNEWVMADDYDYVVHMPASARPGDSFGIYVPATSTTCEVIPPSGRGVESPDDIGNPVLGPSSITVEGGTYYEWIYANTDGGVWRPRQNMRSQPMAAAKSAYKQPVRVVATSHVAAALTGGVATVDGVTLALDDRVLLTAQSSASTNGIRAVSSSGFPWYRPTDADESAKLPPSSIIPVREGTANADTLWTLTTNAVTLDSTALAFQKIGSGAALASTPPTQITVTTAAVGAGTTAARDNHVHSVATGSPVALAVADAGSDGTSTSLARADHGHPMPGLATSVVSGFMSASQFTKLGLLPDPTLNNFRLSNGANSLSDDAVANPLNLVAHNGDRICVYTGTEWAVCRPSVMPTINVSGQSAGIPCDVFAVYSSATALTLELTPWASASARATAIVQVDGVWTKSGAQTRRYLGTILPNAATTYFHQTNATGINGSICGVWNQDNRMLVSFLWTAAFTSWTATGTGWQNLNGVATGKFQLLQGRSTDVMSAVHWASVDAVGATVSVGIGVNSSSTPASGLRDLTNTAAGIIHPLKAEIRQRITAIGVHNIQPIVNTSAATPIFYGANGAGQSGLIAHHWC